MSFSERSFSSLGPHGFHKIAYTQWGNGHGRRVLVCVHGLTRNGRDFDALATALADNWRIACPDIAGRGHSDWLLHREDYGYPLYLADMAAFIARLGAAEVDWIGTSMGGLIGMMLAAQPNSPIRKLVLNDVGPFIPRSALTRIAQYVGKAPHFDTLVEVEAYLRQVHEPFGTLEDAQWRHLTRHSVRRGEKGGFELHYDPGIADAFTKVPLDDVDLWAVWNQVKGPVLVLRGKESDLLLEETARRMVVEGPGADLIEIPGVGHAPTLTAADQIAAVRDWLES